MCKLFATHFAQNESIFSFVFFAKKRRNKEREVRILCSIPSFPLISCRHSICLNGSKATHLLANLQFLCVCLRMKTNF